MGSVRIKRVLEQDIDTVFAIQRAAFEPLYLKYRDDGTSPYLESRDTVLRKYTREAACGYLFLLGDIPVGAVRILPGADNSAKVSALCVLPEYQRRGIARDGMAKIEALHGDIERWHLSTILEEEGNCRLYEKLGYQRIGEPVCVNERMTLVFYEKQVGNE
ncbi:MAG: GNAT family N-acetyltransferase [Clostridia bacterium]|nr:GNAT family N-acetyltransferase [Clostridia bacterium]